MLSYQHLYHAGNLADVHKHAALAWVLHGMAQKNKPLTYLETHAGRGLYDLAAPEAERTGEAAAGIARVEGWFAETDPYRTALRETRAQYGDRAYPGSPLIAALTLRPTDRLMLAELHPREHEALRDAMIATSARVERRDGLEAMLAWTPPEPRRGLMLVDPSWEVKADYDRMPDLFRKVARRWNVGVMMLWYPILADGRHGAMLAQLAETFPDGHRHEVRFPPARAGHGMAGSGLFTVNPPWRLDERLGWLGERFASL